MIFIPFANFGNQPLAFNSLFKTLFKNIELVSFKDCAKLGVVKYLSYFVVTLKLNKLLSSSLNFVLTCNQLWLDQNYILLFSTQICISGITLMSTAFGIPRSKMGGIKFWMSLFGISTWFFKGQLISEAIFLGFKSPIKQTSFFEGFLP